MKSTSMVREARVRTIPSVGTSKIDRHASLRAKTIRLSNGNEIRTLREDGGVSQSRLAAAAGISQSFLSTIEAGTALPSVEILSRLAAGLGADLQVRLYPNTGLPIRDRIQSAMIEALLRELHPRWAATLEVPVRRPARGVIDLVLRDRGGTTMIAVEAQSELRRVEQQLRWAAEKSESLPSADLWHAAVSSLEPEPTPVTISRLLLLRSTRTTRTLARELRSTFESAFPGDAASARHALVSGDIAWPGPALIWMGVAGGRAEFLQRRPRGVGGG